MNTPAKVPHGQVQDLPLPMWGHNTRLRPPLSRERRKEAPLPLSPSLSWEQHSAQV